MIAISFSHDSLCAKIGSTTHFAIICFDCDRACLSEKRPQSQDRLIIFHHRSRKIETKKLRKKRDNIQNLNTFCNRQMNTCRHHMCQTNSSPISNTMSLTSLLNFDFEELKQGRTKPPTRLPPNFRPKRLDVLSGRDKEARSHIGTKHFRQVIKDNLKRYIETKHRDEKSTVIQSIVDFIRCEAMILGGAGFVKRDLNSGRWYEIGDIQAREKVGHALRDLLKTKNSSLPLDQTTKPTASKSLSCMKKQQKQQRKKVTFQQNEKVYVEQQQQKQLEDEPKPELFLCTSNDEVDIMGLYNKEEEISVDFSIFC